MKAWIVGGILVAGILLAEPRGSLGQAQAGAQAASQARAASQQAAPQRQAQAAAPSGQARTPAPAGGQQQRDPFRPIEIKKDEEGQAVDLVPNCTQSGMAGTLVSQVQLQGVASDVGGRRIAVVGNNTGRAYFLRAEDELCNGVVTRVEQGSLVMERRIRDSRGRTRTEEVVLQVPED